MAIPRTISLAVTDVFLVPTAFALYYGSQWSDATLSVKLESVEPGAGRTTNHTMGFAGSRRTLVVSFLGRVVPFLETLNLPSSRSPTSEVLASSYGPFGAVRI
jgi:hypothetical protein